MNQNKGLEISPEDAAAQLGVHVRTIRNLVQKGHVKGNKVNGRWYIDKESVDQAALNKAKFTNTNTTSSTLPASKTHRGPRLLAPYRLCCHAFTEFKWKLDGPEYLDIRTKQLQLTVLELLGAGFYGYGQEKRQKYSEARSALGGLVGLLYPYREQSVEIAKALTFLEEECIAATTSLIRKLENKQKAIK